MYAIRLLARSCGAVRLIFSCQQLHGKGSGRYTCNLNTKPEGEKSVLFGNQNGSLLSL